MIDFLTHRMASATAVVVATLLAVTACTTDETFLPALLADPMASYEAEGIVLIDSSEEEEGRDIILDMPTHAKAVRSYRIEDQGQAEEVLNEAVAFAESEGWRLRPSRTSPLSSFRGLKTLVPGDVAIGISLVAADPLGNPDGPRVLRINLEYGSVRFDETTVPGEGE